MSLRLAQKAGVMPAILRTQVGVQARCLSAAATRIPLASQSPAPRAASESPLIGSNPLVSGGGLGVSALARPAGRQSVSGIVATVFGGSGFLGGYVVNHLGRIGSQVVTPYRSIDGMNVRHLKLAGDLGQIVPIPLDLGDMDNIRRCIARSNVVINLIGYKHETSNYSYNDVHEKIAYRLAQVSKAMGVERFIHVSALGAADQSPSAFYQSKWDGEQAVKSFYPDATILRPAIMFGPQDHFLSYYGYIGNKLMAIPMTNGGQRVVQPVFVGDVARSVLNAIADPASKGQTYELAGPQRYTEKEIVEMCAEHTGRKPWMFNMSDAMGTMYGKIVGGRRVYKFIPGDSPSSRLLTLLGSLGTKLTQPGIFHPDMVQQKHVDVVASGRFPGLEQLGVGDVRTLENEIARALLAHRRKAEDRFPDAEIMKRDAKDTASF